MAAVTRENHLPNFKNIQIYVREKIYFPSTAVLNRKERTWTLVYTHTSGKEK